MIKLPFGVDIKNLIDDLRIFSWEASETLIYYAQILKDSNNKINILENDNEEDPVTTADLKVNEMIIKKINKKYKNVNWGILSEENAKSTHFNLEKYKDWMWVLDPLDGTKDFIQGTSNYAMHLALNYKCKPFLGVVLIPEKDELWISDGKNVWCEKRDGSKIQPTSFKKSNLREMVLVTSKNHKNQALEKLIKKINFNQVKVMGSVGCKIASILRGESDIYISLSLKGRSSPKDWDFAAPEAILKSSGGKITNLDNQDLFYGYKNFEQGGVIVASNNKDTHQSICSEIKRVIKEYDILPLNH